ncbi:hypothetical protein K402DRAFT_67356 [Aulographum hederae CBS 113979]|uniref:Uncharacterized protein n=1 Tax=Aulographum hederae CBS 113979 TaxID=1176131 RepID=A0A6G1H0W9_9PEZI|nr:hypothetical protein K402DRAFT_67356 [Aulographum hederae CBS 113979]
MGNHHLRSPISVRPFSDSESPCAMMPIFPFQSLPFSIKTNEHRRERAEEPRTTYGQDNTEPQGSAQASFPPPDVETVRLGSCLGGVIWKRLRFKLYYDVRCGLRKTYLNGVEGADGAYQDGARPALCNDSRDAASEGLYPNPRSSDEDSKKADIWAMTVSLSRAMGLTNSFARSTVYLDGNKGCPHVIPCADTSGRLLIFLFHKTFHCPPIWRSMYRCSFHLGGYLM